VLGAATSARLAGGPGVKVTGAVAFRLPTVAVTVARPATVELSVAVATPLVVTLVTGDALPRLVVKLTTTLMATGLPNWSVTVAVSTLRLPTGSVLGAATSARLAGGPGVKVTGAVAFRLPTVAVTVARPATVELSVAVATPLVVTLVSRRGAAQVRCEAHHSAIGHWVAELVGHGRGQRAQVAHLERARRGDERQVGRRAGREGHRRGCAQAADRRCHHCLCPATLS
jgi:hypothetical protein